jgi:hypothetical protein
VLQGKDTAFATGFCALTGALAACADVVQLTSLSLQGQTWLSDRPQVGVCSQLQRVLPRLTSLRTLLLHETMLNDDQPVLVDAWTKLTQLEVLDAVFALEEQPQEGQAFERNLVHLFRLASTLPHLHTLSVAHNSGFVWLPGVTISHTTWRHLEMCTKLRTLNLQEVFRDVGLWPSGIVLDILAWLPPSLEGLQLEICQGSPLITVRAQLPVLWPPKLCRLDLGRTRFTHSAEVLTPALPSSLTGLTFSLHDCATRDYQAVMARVPFLQGLQCLQLEIVRRADTEAQTRALLGCLTSLQRLTVLRLPIKCFENARPFDDTEVQLSTGMLCEVHSLARDLPELRQLQSWVVHSRSNQAWRNEFVYNGPVLVYDGSGWGALRALVHDVARTDSM